MSHLPDIKNVEGVQFSISSPEDIRKHSVVEVTKFETYDKDVPVVLRVYLIFVWVLLIGILCVVLVIKRIHVVQVILVILNLAKPVLNYHFIQTI